MYFFLKKTSSEEPQLISLKYRFSPKQLPFTYSTNKKILPSEWDFDNKMPKTIRGRADLGIIRKRLQRILDHLNAVIAKADNLDSQLSKEYLKTEFDRKFKNIQSKARRQYFTDFVQSFIKEAPTMINRSTKTFYNESQIKNYNTALKKFQEFEAYRGKRIYIDEFTLEVYDDFLLYCSNVCDYSINYQGALIKSYKKFLGLAEDHYKLHVSDDYKKSEFARIKEKTEAIALSEDEINKIYTHDFSHNPILENCRDFAIIGFWTGMRIGDLMKQQVDLTKDYITVTPSKTKKSSGIVVMIPIHENVREIVKKRGTPKPINDIDFNVYIKDICKAVGLDDMTKGSLLVYNEEKAIWRKKLGVYEKYKLVSSHTMRRSFATNLYKAGFDMLSIMQITGHKKVEVFLNYIKVPPIEHAKRLNEFWNKKPKENEGDLLLFLLKKMALEKYGDDWKAKLIAEATRDL